MIKTVYLELQEIKANSEAILFSISQLEAFMAEQETKDEAGQKNPGGEPGLRPGDEGVTGRED